MSLKMLGWEGDEAKQLVNNGANKVVKHATQGATWDES